MPANRGKHTITRRPTESGTALLGAIGAVVIYALDLDQEIAWTVPIIVGACPAAITWFVDLIASRFGAEDDAP